MSPPARLALAAVLATATRSAALAADGVATLSVGADYTKGNYGQSESTEILSVPVTAKYEAGRWVYKLMVPYIRITGPGNVVGGDRVVLPGEAAGRRTESGLGDVVASAAYGVLSGREVPFQLDLTGKVKFGTADEARGLGTGKNDYALQLDAYQAYGRLTPFATLGYRWYGDPEGFDLIDVYYGSLGLSYRISPSASAGLAYDARNRIVEGGARVRELTAFVSCKFSRDWKLQLYAIKGYADASPDRGAGAVLAYSF
jgi:outer membrane scaffolding protein for murein synthesis (MipA/OmpV family)